MEDRESFDESRREEVVHLLEAWGDTFASFAMHDDDPLTVGQMIIAASIGVAGREVVRQLVELNENLSKIKNRLAEIEGAIGGR